MTTFRTYPESDPNTIKDTLKYHIFKYDILKTLFLREDTAIFTIKT